MTVAGPLASCLLAARAIAISVGAIALVACTAIAPVNPPITRAKEDQGYHIVSLLNRPRPGNNPKALVLLAFSGGGTRAAALSYGVLEELRRTPVVVEGQIQRFLDEVDLVAGVSGGSFTALAYALYGERLFTEFEPRFLKRDVQGELISRVLSPRNWARLGSAAYGRSELAADYYDEILFGGATFADLLRQKTPVALVTGTDLSTGARFEFSQDNFDLLCSDLGTVRLARAAATSSAVPVVLSPVTYRNYGGTCGATMPTWVQDVANADNPERPAGRALLRYREIRDLEDSKNRPFIHVVDGGVSDNLGLRGMLEAFEEMEASPKFQQELDFAQLRHVVVIAVNSRSAPSTNWDRSSTPPGFVSQLLQSSSVPIDHFSYESVELLKDIAQRWANRRSLTLAQLRLSGMSQAEAEASVQKITFDAIDVSFDAIADSAERRYFMDLPTSFVLPSEAVDRLRGLGSKLLRDSSAFQKLLVQFRDVNDAATRPVPTAAGAVRHQ
ncbi:patatin-like phospholipase family protein [Variovorax sp. EBFNA2]|uniref:patatin-like phospholipase family protein n=1 Tax=Variovorax sp. EBFNA2 TaxID=3342097 RepID=UPI0029C034C0|nr:patatin-like phospholipase family protein [Variovorax boronicumulans]WPG41061.1 patatin-like phospholipase family protein [Variovorax boronicumulans]